MTLYTVREEELERLHKNILDEKNKLLEEMRIYAQQLGQDSEASAAAHKRNQTILQVMVLWSLRTAIGLKQLLFDLQSLWNRKNKKS